jgi:hypothetical protein
MICRRDEFVWSAPGNDQQQDEFAGLQHSLPCDWRDIVTGLVFLDSMATNMPRDLFTVNSTEFLYHECKR